MVHTHLSSPKLNSTQATTKARPLIRSFGILPHFPAVHLLTSPGLLNQTTLCPAHVNHTVLHATLPKFLSPQSSNSSSSLLGEHNPAAANSMDNINHNMHTPLHSRSSSSTANNNLNISLVYVMNVVPPLAYRCINGVTIVVLNFRSSSQDSTPATFHPTMLTPLQKLTTEKVPASIPRTPMNSSCTLKSNQLRPSTLAMLPTGSQTFGLTLFLAS